MNFIRFIIARKVLVCMVFIAVSMLGWFSLRELPIELIPNSEIPYLMVTVSAQTEMDPNLMEKQAVIPVESAVSKLAGVSEIETTVNQNRGQIRITYGPTVKMKYAALKLDEAVTAVKESLPEGYTVSVQRTNTEQLTSMFMEIQVRGEGGLERLRSVIDKSITRELESVNGIASVNTTGGRTKSVEILLDDEACRANNITPSTIRSLISRNNSSRTFVGEARGGGRRYFVTLVADYTDVRDIERLIVNTKGPVYLADVAQVSFGAKEETSISRVNGKDAITIQLMRDSQVNLIALAKATRQVVSRLNDELKSQDIELVVQSDTARDMERNIRIIEELALIGALLSVAVLWLFLRNIRLVLVIVLAIPVSILGAFNFFFGFGVSINTLTLVGIALAVGMLLDTGVVVLENIIRLLASHRDRDTAVIQGTSEVWRSIVASTITTVTVFMPFFFSSEYTYRIIGHHVGVSVVSTLVMALFAGLILTPTIVHALLGRSTDLSSRSFSRVSGKNRLIQIYTLLLKTAMRYPAATVFSAVVAFFAVVAISFSVSLNVSREVQLKAFPLYLTPSSGATLETTDTLTKELEARLADIPEKQDIITRVFEEESSVTIVLKDNYEKIKKRSIPQIKTDIQRRIENFPGGEVSLSEPTSSARYGGSSGASSQLGVQKAFGIGTQSERILVRGSDFDVLRAVGEDVRYYLDQLESVQSVNFNVQDSRPELQIHFDREFMSREGITLNNISSELSSFGREVSTTVPFKQGTDEYDITILSKEATEEENTQKTADDLREMPIQSSSGTAWELDQLGRFVFGSGKSVIHRLNQEKQLEVTYRFTSDVNESKPALLTARQDVDAVVASLSLPPGVAVEVIHDETDTSEFSFLILAAFALIYMILASVFESFTSPLVMMFTIPLAAIGALGALVMTGNSLLTASALLGMLILIGVVVNNGILLIDFTRILRERGFSRERALLTAGRARIRPILITSITTVIGMLPLALGKSEYVGMIGSPFAIAVVGGLSLSTLFTLVFIPTVYSGLESSLAWFRALDLRIKLLQVAVFAVLAALIYTTIDGLLLKCLALTAAVILVPAVFWLVVASLRQASAEFIPRGEAINISIRRLVKVYDGDGRFVREWKKGARMTGPEGSVASADHLLWMVPILGFLVYFTFFYLYSPVWKFIFAHPIYFMSITMWRIFARRFMPRGAIAGWVETALVWLLPAAIVGGFLAGGFRIAPAALVGAFWYAALVVQAGARRKDKLGIVVTRITGRFAGIRVLFYRIVGAIPVIGSKKKPFCALDGVSLEIGSGMFGLLGPNGAGKTTVMRIICGILSQNMGAMRINGIDFSEKREELQGLIGYLPQEFGTYENMTAREFLDYIAMLKRIRSREERAGIVERVLAQVHLAENADQKIGSFSGGMKQRMGIALTLLHLPRILVVDEPTAGLDPRERIRFRNLLVELSRERIVIFSTHIIEDISSSCNRLAVLSKGHLAYLGNPREMTEAVRGKVWQFLADDAEFEQARTQLRIVHHMRVGDRIRVRCLAENAPTPDAEMAQPTLEDAYLWLLDHGVVRSLKTPEQPTELPQVTEKEDGGES